VALGAGEDVRDLMLQALAIEPSIAGWGSSEAASGL
jgi:hypothetical protein